MDILLYIFIAESLFPCREPLDIFLYRPIVFCRQNEFR